MSARARRSGDGRRVSQLELPFVQRGISEGAGAVAPAVGLSESYASWLLRRGRRFDVVASFDRAFSLVGSSSRRLSVSRPDEV